MSKEKNKQLQDLEDLGWQRMQEILDREMPQKRRRLAWWLWPVAAALPVMFWVLATWNTPPNSSVINNQHADQGVESTVKEEQKLALLNHADSSHQEDVSSDAPATTSMARATRLVPAAGSSLNQEDAIQVESTATTMPFEDSGIEIPMHTVTSPPTGIEALPQDHVVATDVHEASPETVRAQRLLARLEVPSFSGLFLVGYDLGESLDIPTAPIQHKRRKWHVDLLAGMLAETGGQKFGWEAGLGTTVRLHHRWSLSSGISFWRIQDYEDFSQMADLTQSFSASNVLDPEPMDQRVSTPGTNLDNQTLYQGETKILSYLVIPIGVVYNNSSRWTPSLGVSWMGLISNASASRTQEDALEFDNLGTTQVQDIPNLVRSSNWLLEVGLRYRIWPSGSLDIRYRHGFDSYLNYSVGSGGVPELHRHVRFAFIYAIR